MVPGTGNRNAARRAGIWPVRKFFVGPKPNEGGSEGAATPADPNQPPNHSEIRQMADEQHTPLAPVGAASTLHLCRKCGTQKPTSDFYIIRGYVQKSTCKSCWSAAGKIRRELKRDSYREKARQKRQKTSAKVALLGRDAILSIERLKATLHYDPETGKFSRLASSGGAHIGDEPGYFNDNGYRIISIDGVKYRAHRLAWFYMTGEWPKEDIDHRNTISDDNRWENLREATDQQNLQNQGMPQHNTSGLKGASWREDKQKWRASICSHKKWRHLGYFDTKEEAHAAYCAAALELNGEFANFG